MRVTISPKYQIVIPLEIRKLLHIHPGDMAEVIPYENRIEVLPVKNIKQMRGFLKGMDTQVRREGDRV